MFLLLNVKGSNKVGTTKLSWSFLWFLIIAVGVAGLSGYAAYKYRIRVCYATLFTIIHILWSFCHVDKMFEVTKKKTMVQRYMDAEIRGIMAQYMPLESQPNPRGPHMDI